MMSWTKFHCSVTKTPRLRPGGINLFPHHFLGQYRTTLAMRKLSRVSQGKTSKLIPKVCSGALEAWGPFGYHQEAAEDVGVYSEEDFGRCQEEPHLAGGGGGLPAEPGDGAADKVSGGDCQGGWHDQILN